MPFLFNVTATGEGHRTFLTNFSDGVYTYDCFIQNITNGLFSNEVSRTLTINTNIPTITLLTNNNWKTDNTTILSPFIHNLTVNISFADDNSLFETAINFTFENGTSYFLIHNTSLTGNTTDNISITIDISSFPLGNYTLQLAASDPHTNEVIGDYKTKEGLFNNYLEYETEEGITIRIETLESILGIRSVSTTKQKDRYSFKWEFWNEKTTAKFRVTSSQPLQYIQSKYNAHLVTLNGMKGNWIDFDSLGLKPGNYEVIRVDEYTYDITIKGVNLKTFEFNSIGGLNLVQNDYKIQLGAVIDVWVFNQGNGLAINFTANLTGIIKNGTPNNGTTFYNITKGIKQITIQSPGFNTRLLSLNISSSFHNFSINLTTNNLDNCSVYDVVILNYTLFDESNRTLIENQSENIKISVTVFNLSSTTPWIEYSNEENSNNVQVCISEIKNDSEYRLYSIIEYSTDNHVHEFDYIQNMDLTIASNIPREIALYDLSTSLSTSFIITFKNNVFLPVENAIIEVLRFYTEIGQNIAVEDGLTDETGQTITHLITEDVTYGFIVKKDAVVLATFSDILATCPVLPCQINLNQFESITEIEEFGEFDNLVFNFEFNKTERTIDGIFIVLDSTSAKMNLNATLFDHFGNSTVCQETLTSSSGTLSCIVPTSFGNSTIRLNLYMDDELVTTRYFDFSIKGAERFGFTGYFMAAILYLTLVLMAISDPVGMIIFAIIGLVFSGALGLLATNKLFALGSVIIWFLVAGVIIIWKIKQRENV